jgi:hypothetical protein
VCLSKGFWGEQGGMEERHVILARAQTFVIEKQPKGESLGPRLVCKPSRKGAGRASAFDDAPRGSSGGISQQKPLAPTSYNQKKKDFNQDLLHQFEKWGCLFFLLVGINCSYMHTRMQTHTHTHICMQGEGERRGRERETGRPCW